MTRLFYLGFTQERVPVGIRERLHADAARRRRIARAASELADGTLVLSTCERFEVYAAARDASAESWIGLLAREFGFSQDALAGHSQALHGTAVAEHLLRVASGLESRLLGERNVHRQVRAAFLDALAHNELGPVLTTLGQTAIHAGKRVRRTTNLAAAGATIVGLACDRFMSTLDDAEHSQVVLLGTGALAREALARLAGRRACDITIVSRCLDRAQALGNRYGARAAMVADLPARLREARALLACSDSTAGFLVDRTTLGSRREKPLNIVDLGVPRNVDPDLATLAGVTLTHLEQLHAFDAAPAAEVRAAEAIVAQQLARFRHWLRARQVATELRALTAESAIASADSRKLHERIVQLKAQVAA